jgi:hypothetical protein
MVATVPLYHLILWCALELILEARAGCGKAARPDLWRGLWVNHGSYSDSVRDCFGMVMIVLPYGDVCFLP